MSLITVAGTRPELIRLSIIIEKLDKSLGRGFHKFVWTGQNYTPNLSDIFFSELNIRNPDYFLKGGMSSLSHNVGKYFELLESVINKERPSGALILGDTNSALTAIICERMGVPVIHMEAGNRCYDKLVPEEINRKIIDHASTWLLPYTYSSKSNLISEGIPFSSIFVCGNPIYEIINRNINIYSKESCSDKYILCTFHRQETVDNRESLLEIVSALKEISDITGLEILCPTHPRTKSKLKEFGIEISHEKIKIMEPVGLKAFMALELGASIVLTDSGTVQEECCIMGVQSVTIRNSTERPETVHCGSNVVSGVCSERIVKYTMDRLSHPRTWHPPSEYLDAAVSDKVVDFISGKLR